MLSPRIPTCAASRARRAAARRNALLAAAPFIRRRVAIPAGISHIQGKHEPAAQHRGPGAAARLERLPISGYHRVIFIIIAGAFFFDSIDLGMMTFVLGSIKQEFGLSTAQAGLLASSSFLGMAAGAALSGLLADRFGRKPVFQVSMIIWGVASYLCSTPPPAPRN